MFWSQRDGEEQILITDCTVEIGNKVNDNNKNSNNNNNIDNNNNFEETWYTIQWLGR